MLNNNPLVLAEGVESLMAQCSEARAGRIGLGNTPRFLVDRSTRRPTRRSRSARSRSCRDARLRSFNDYREAFGADRARRSFDELTADPDLQRGCGSSTATSTTLEWYVGIFAEDYPDYCMMGELMTTMVAYDAFTQALTNPLLGRQVYNEDTFSELGFDVLKTTSTLQQIVARNSSTPAQVHCSFRC